MIVSNRPKVVIQDPYNSQYLQELPPAGCDAGLAQWTMDRASALILDMPQVLTLAGCWSLLDNCSILPVPVQALGALA